MFDALGLSSLRSRACEFFVAFQIVYLHHFFPLLCVCKASLPPESILANKLFLRVENICPNFRINSWLPSRGRFGNGQCKPFEFSLGRYVPCPKLLRMLVGCNFQ